MKKAAGTVLLGIALIVAGCGGGGDSSDEMDSVAVPRKISSHPEYVSCIYNGITGETTSDGESGTIALRFANKTDKDLAAVHGMFTVKTKDTGELVYMTGVSRRREIAVGEGIDYEISGERLGPSTDAYAALSERPRRQQITFRLTQIEYVGGLKKNFQE